MIDCFTQNDKRGSFVKVYSKTSDLINELIFNIHESYYSISKKDDAPFNRKELKIFLEDMNIQTRVIFTGNVTRQLGFNDIQKRVADGGYPVSDEFMRGGMLLACYHGLTEEMLNHVHSSFDIFANQYS